MDPEFTDPNALLLDRLERQSAALRQLVDAMRKGRGMSEAALREYTALLQRADAERERLQALLDVDTRAS